MADITLDEKTLYYQYLINNNSTSTMLNAISGTNTDNTYNTLGSLSSIGSLGGTGSILDFSSILEQYLSGVNTNSYEEAMEATTMADKLSSVLEEAAETEDTNSLTYKTVQELYEYFSEQVSAKASALMGNTASQSSNTSASSGTVTTSSLEQMNQSALRGQEYDFSEIDDIVDSIFEEQMPLS